MSRPIRFCAKCGEYIAEMNLSRRRHGQLVTMPWLVHIDADGELIYRNHAPVEL